MSAPQPFVGTPNAERYLLAADTLRRRQLCAALLHGTGRTWRDRPRIWPSAVAGVVAMVLVVAAIAVYGAFRKQQEVTKEQRPARPPASPARR